MRLKEKLYEHWILLLVLVVQGMLVSYTFPLYELWSNTPLFFSDAVRHWYRLKVAVSLAQTGNSIGYDPFFAAGSPAGLLDNAAARIPAVAAIALGPWISEMTIWKTYAFGSALIGPPSIPLALRWLRLDTKVIILASLLGLVLWWASMFHWFHTQGMVAFVSVSFLALPYFACIINYLDNRGGWKTLVGLSVSGALLMFCHPLFPLPIIIGTLFYLCMSWSSSRLSQKLLLLTVVPTMSVLPNLWWVYLEFFYIIPQPYIQGGYQNTADIHLVWKELMGMWETPSHGSKMYPLLFISALWAFIKPPSGHERKLVYCFWSLWVSLTLLAHVGSSIHFLHRIQPNRFAPVAYLFLTIPGAIGVLGVFKTMRGPTYGVRRLAAIASLIVITFLGLFNLNEVRREVSYGNVGHYGEPPPEVRPLGEYSKWIINWLKTNTSSEGRVLFELSLKRIYDKSRMVGYYVDTNKQEFIGGPYPFTYFANFWDEWLFNQPIEKIQETRFNQYVKLYNLGWILAHSEGSKRYFDRMPGVQPIAEFKKLKAYTIEGPLTYFLKGQGHVEHRDYNQLRLTHLNGDPIILKYHYLPGIKSDPPAQIEPIYLMDDPNPFIKIINPPITLKLYL